MTTTDHVTEHVTDHACDVSLIEHLKSVPHDSITQANPIRTLIADSIIII
jgi:hypothetical protein